MTEKLPSRKLLIGAIMSISSRRRFMQNVGSGMLIAGLGSNLAIELGTASEDSVRPSGHR